jgi:hypothetical protein
MKKIKTSPGDYDELLRQYRRLRSRRRRREKLLRRILSFLKREEKRLHAEDLPVIRF